MEFLIKMLGIPIEVAGVELVRISGVDGISMVKIGGPCSGLYSMFLLIGIVVGFAAADRVGDVKEILGIMLITITVAWLANIFRVSILYVVATLYETNAMNGAHMHLGWIIFAFVSAVVMILLDKVRKATTQ